jgi:hypothetical protein
MCAPDASVESFRQRVAKKQDSVAIIRLLLPVSYSGCASTASIISRKSCPNELAGWPFRISRNATGESKADASMARANRCRSRSGAAIKTDPRAATIASSDFCGIALASSVSGSIYLNERTRRPASNFCAPLKSIPIRQPTPDSKDRAKTAAQPERRRGRAREAQCPLSVSFFAPNIGGAARPKNVSSTSMRMCNTAEP